MEGEIVPKSETNNNELEKQMTESLTRGYGPKVARLAMAIVGGAIPFLAVLSPGLLAHGRRRNKITSTGLRQAGCNYRRTKSKKSESRLQKFSLGWT
jgi:hypothetical protein